MKEPFPTTSEDENKKNGGERRKKLKKKLKADSKAEAEDYRQEMQVESEEVVVEEEDEDSQVQEAADQEDDQYEAEDDSDGDEQRIQTGTKRKRQTTRTAKKGKKSLAEQHMGNSSDPVFAKVTKGSGKQVYHLPERVLSAVKAHVKSKLQAYADRIFVGNRLVPPSKFGCNYRFPNNGGSTDVIVVPPHPSIGATRVGEELEVDDIPVSCFSFLLFTTSMHFLTSFLLK